jgi:hypothetical protein
MSQRKILTALGTAALVLGGGLLAGCSSTSTNTSSTSSTSATPPTTIPYVAADNARSDVSLTTPCPVVNGALEASGKISNSAKVARSYQIVVDFITQPGDTVKATKVVGVKDVAAGATVPWSTSSSSGSSMLTCVIRQVQAH